jgi:hypothetical protein
MKKTYIAIPVLIYVEAYKYENAAELYDRINEPITDEIDDAIVYFAEDFLDGLVTIDHSVEEFSGMITKDCKPV